MLAVLDLVCSDGETREQRRYHRETWGVTPISDHGCGVGVGRYGRRNGDDDRENDKEGGGVGSDSRAIATSNPLRFSTDSSLGHIRMENGSDLRSSSRGALIVLEGLDRSGKTLQSSRLVSFLREKQIPVEAWRFPDRSTCIGQMISAYLSNEKQLDDRAVHLLFSANRWEKRVQMESKLRTGTSLVVDRYSYSGVAFSSAKGLDIDWCKAPEAGLIAPDLVLYLDVSPEKAAERGGYGSERYEQLEFQRTVTHYYGILRDTTWEVVDGCLPVEAVERRLRGIALECIGACQKGKPLANLWSSK